MHYFEAPALSYSCSRPSVFLAGGITGCPLWQMQAVQLLEHKDIDIFNPRRLNFPMDDPNAALEQITWERHCLHQAKTILFWFCKETTQPIVLFELGYHLARSKFINGFRTGADKKICIGIEPGYAREQDVRIQTQLVYPKFVFATNLPDLCAMV